MQHIVNKKLIFDSFDGKATSFQKTMIDEWVKAPENAELFYQWLQEWENQHLQFAADKEAGLLRFQQFLGRDAREIPEVDEPMEAVAPERRALGKWWLRIAAALAVFFVFWNYQSHIFNTTVKTGFNEKKMLRLEDGSRVALNSNSTLSVSRFSFFSGERRVRLEGEALFSVRHTEDDKRFVVETANGEQVVVLGTEFNLFARERGTRIVLQKGKVQLHYKKPDHMPGQLTMKPGDQVAVSREGVASIKPVMQPGNSSEWLNNRYVFEQSSVEEITQLFKDNFGINIKVSAPEVKAMTLSGAYPYENAEELLVVVSEALNLQLTRMSDGSFLLGPETAL